MSGATYRIETEHQPGETLAVRWVARIYELPNDGAWIKSFHHSTEDMAYNRAAEWIAAQNTAQEGHTFYVDESGQPVEHSVKA